MDESVAVELVTFLSHDERVDLLAQLPEDRYETLVKWLAKKEREDVRRLESHEEGTIGAIMTSDYVALSPEMTVSKALEKIRSEAPDAETIYYAYVLDAERHLEGILSLKYLILARPETRIDSIKRRREIRTAAAVKIDVLRMEHRALEETGIAQAVMPAEGFQSRAVHLPDFPATGKCSAAESGTPIRSEIR